MRLLLLSLLLIPLIGLSAVRPNCNGVSTYTLGKFIWIYEPDEGEPLDVSRDGNPVNTGLIVRIGIVNFRNTAQGWVIIEGKQSYGPPWFIGARGPDENWHVINPDEFTDWQLAKDERKKVVCSIQ